MYSLYTFPLSRRFTPDRIYKATVEEHGGIHVGSEKDCKHCLFYWAFFETKEDRAKCRDELLTLGYYVTTCYPDAEAPIHPPNYEGHI